MKLYRQYGYWNVVSDQGLLIARDPLLANVLEAIRGHWSGKP